MLRCVLTLLHSGRPKLHTILAFMSAIGLNLSRYIFQMVNLFCWLLCIGICCAVIYGGYTDGDSHIFSLDESVAYQALSRTGWGVVVCWIVFACATGHGGIFKACFCFTINFA